MTKKRVLSILLCLSMICSLLPTTAQAASTTTVNNASELQSAISNASSGDTIKLGANITFNSASQIRTVADVYQDRKSLTYELEAQHRRQKSYTIVGIDWDWEDIDDPAWQEATIDYQLPEEFRPEHSSEGTGGIGADMLWIRNEKLADENGNTLYVHEDGDATTYLLIDGKNLTIDLNGKTINATHNDAYFSALFVTGGSTVTIKGNGGITSSNTAITANGSGTTVNIQGGSFTGYTAVAAIYNATVNITGGSFTGKNVTERVVSTTVSLDKTSEYTIYTAEGNPLWQGLLLNSGYSYRAEWEYRGTAKRTVNCATLYCENYGAINVSGNPTVKAPSGGTLFYVPGSWTVGYTSDFGTYISGGTFEGSMKKGSACATGGAFSENPQGVITGLSSGVLPQFRDCLVEKNSDGTYGVVSQEVWNSRGYVAAIGDVGYYSLDAAINDAENGNRIRLLKDIAGPLTLSKAKTYTLDLDGHTINDYVTVKAGNVTITDGTINYTGDGNALKTEGNSAVLTADCTVYAPSGVALSAGYGSANGGTVNVTGGEYTGRLGTAAGGALSITGGKFKNDPSVYVAEGYVAKKGTDDWYTVRVGVPVTSMEIWTKDDLLAFKAEVEKGADADVDGILMANINLSGTDWDPIGLNPSVAYRGTFDGNGYSIQNLTSTTGGLFHKIGAQGTVCNLRIASGTISSSGNVGAIADECGGTIVDCSNAASVTCNGGDAYVYAGGIVGAYGTIRRCSNSGTITGSHAVGGIMGGNGSPTLNCYDCYNTGQLVYSGPEKKASSGIYGIGNSNASNCYNTGVMSYTNKPKSIRNIASMSVTKGYYVTSYYVSNGGSTSESTENPDGTQKTAAQFASGEVTWLLNNESADGPWYQNLPNSGRTADSYPVLDPTHLRVYKTSSGKYTNITYYSVWNPDNLSVSYGTSAQILAQLPATVEVRGVADSDYRSYYYDVEWDMDSSGFDPQSLESQTITIPGKVNVTDMTNGGVKNVSIQVTVAAPGISRLELDAAPSLTYEAGASLNLSGTRVSAIYVNGVVVNLTDATEGVAFNIANGATLSKTSHDGKTVSLTYKGKTVTLGTLNILSTDNTIQTLKVHGETATYADGAYAVTLPPDKTLPSSESDISVTLRDASATVVSKTKESEENGTAVWQITVGAENGVEAVYPLHIDIAPPYANQNEATIAEITNKWNALTKSWTAAQADVQRDDVQRPGSDPATYLTHSEILNRWLSGQVYTALAIPEELEDYVSISIALDDPVSWAIAGARADHDGTDGSFAFTVTVTASKGGNSTDHKTATLTGDSGIITATPYTVPDYTVNFDSQSGSAVASITVKEDTPIGNAAPAAPTRTDYRFTGWYKEVACTTLWDMDNDEVTTDPTTLYAGWSWSKTETTVDSITRTSAANPAANEAETVIRIGDTISITAAAKLAASSDPTTLTDDTGSFKFYNGDPDSGGELLGTATATGDVQNGYTATLTGIVLNSDNGFTASSSYDIYAVFSGNNALDTSKSTNTLTVEKAIYTVTFADTGDAAVDPQYVEDGGTATTPDPAPTKTGHNFAGWYTGTDYTTLWDFGTDTVTGSTTIYAGWTWRGTATTIGDFDRTTAANPDANEAATVIRMGDTISISASATTTAPGGSVVLPDGSDLKFTFYNGDPANGGEKLGEVTAARSGSGYAATLTGVALTTANGFDGSGDYTIYAVFSGSNELDTSSNHKTLTVAPAIYTVTFDSEGGSAVAPQYVVDGDPAQAPASPAKTNYKFAGWYADANGTAPWAFGSTAVTGHTTLHAGWSWSVTSTTVNAPQRTAAATPGANEDAAVIRIGDTVSVTATAELTNGGAGTMTGSTAANFKFYNGDPNNGGKLLGTATATGDAQNGYTATLDGVKLNNGNGFTSDGTFTIYAVFSGNDATDGSQNSTTLTVQKAIYEVAFADTGDTAIPPQYIVDGGTATTPSSDPTKHSYNFAGWYSDAAYTQYWLFTDPVENNMTLYAKWSYNPVYDIDGAVTDSDNQALSGIEITLKRGNTIIHRTVTDSEGKYEFTRIAPGIYNIVAERIVQQNDGSAVEQTVTVLEELIDHNDTTPPITMPPANVNSVIELPPNAPEIMVGGLNDEAIHEADNSSDIVTVGMEITPTAPVTGEPSTQEQTKLQQEQQAIQQEASGKTLDFIAFDVIKTVTPSGGGSSTETKIPETKNVLEIVVAFDFTGKENVAIYRYHDGQAAPLTPAAGRSAAQDGTYSLDKENGFIHIFSQKYSLYAIGYTVPAPPSSGGGGGVSTYRITVENSEHGAVKSSQSYASYGTTVTLTVTPEESYGLKQITVTDSSGNTLELTDMGGGKYSFKMPARSVVVQAVFSDGMESEPCDGGANCPSARFTDVNLSLWYHEALDYVVSHGLMAGTSTTTFSPDATTSRGMIAQILYRKEGEPAVIGENPFTDVAEDKYYHDAIVWAEQNGIVGGYGGGLYGPDDPITREQLAAILWRYAQYKGWDVSVGENTNILSYKDFDRISEYAIPAMQWACVEGIMGGYDGNLMPADSAKRSHAAAMLMRFLQSITK